jgi:transposase
MVRLATDQRTRDYVDKRLSEGKTKTEAIRCLKRYIAREVFNALPREALV